MEKKFAKKAGIVMARENTEVPVEASKTEEAHVAAPKQKLVRKNAPVAVLKKKVKKVHGMMNEFREFLRDYKILGIAAGLVIGSAVTALTSSIVGGIITPALQLLIPSDSIKSLVFPVGGVVFQVGVVVTALINFIVVALLFFLFVKVFMKQKKVTKDVLTK